MGKPEPQPEKTSVARNATELVLFLLVLLVPLVAVWGASSLAAMSSGRQDAAVVLGLLLFPIVPVTWEVVAWRRRQRAKVQRPRITTLVDRLTLRTLAVTLPFLVPMVTLWPAPLFQALTTRGDWFLDGVRAPWAEGARHAVLGAADGLVWMYDAVHENPWRDDGGQQVVVQQGTGPGPMPTRGEVTVRNPHPDPVPPPTTTVAADPVPVPTPVPVPVPVPVPAHWPFPETLHPLAHDPPADAAASIDSLGHYYEAQITDETERAKAIHDWVADHVAYDVASYRAHTIPPQTAEATFTTHLSVCAGYARLFDALGRAAGLHTEVVIGDARNHVGESEGHAWNALEIDGTWYLVDTTWDAGNVDGDTFTRDYGTDYFMVPAEAMIVTHFPDETRWQLMDHPITRGDWNRQPLLRPGFFAAGLTLVAPDRGAIDGGPRVMAHVASRGGQFLLASAIGSDGARTECDVTGLDVACDLPSRGAWTVYLYASPERWGTYPEVGSFDVSYR